MNLQNNELEKSIDLKKLQKERKINQNLFNLVKGIAIEIGRIS